MGVDLGALKINFAAGADQIAADVDAGIEEIAKAEMDMLDSMIQLLETIVAMEEFSKIDIDSDGLDFSELFQEVTVLPDGTTIYQWTAGA
jgi:hypothetical protein